MKTQWMAVAVISAAVAAGCGEKTAENQQGGTQNESTTVAVPQETGGQANLQPATDQPAVSSNRDAAPRPSNSPVGTTSRPRSTQAARDERPVDPVPSTANRVAPAAASRPAPVVRYVTIPSGTLLPLELTTA